MIDMYVHPYVCICVQSSSPLLCVQRMPISTSQIQQSWPKRIQDLVRNYNVTHIHVHDCNQHPCMCGCVGGGYVHVYANAIYRLYSTLPSTPFSHVYKYTYNVCITKCTGALHHNSIVKHLVGIVYTCVQNYSVHVYVCIDFELEGLVSETTLPPQNGLKLCFSIIIILHCT